jgi:group I intron endonuclease
MYISVTSILNEDTPLNSNTYGCEAAGKYNKFNSVKSKRFYSTKATSLENYKFNLQKDLQDINIELDEDLKILHSLYIKDLFKDRAAPVIPFDSNLILDTCNLGDIKERSVFLKEWGTKGGIYIIEYKYNPLIYYIGRTTLLKRRMNNHIKAESNSKFHVFLNLIGLEHFQFSIIETCAPDIVEQGKRENYYLQKFLPILNTTFSSSYTESAIYTSLTSKLINLKSINSGPDTQISNKPITIFVYSFNEDKGINPIYDQYNSMAEASKIEKIAYNTLLLFRDTNVPFRGKLYYTKSIIDFNSTLDQIKNNLKDVKIYSNMAIEIWAYDAQTLTLLKGSPFQSKTQAANLIGISRDVINYFLDTKKPEGVKGTYLFSRPLEDIEIKGLKELSESILLGNKVKV